MAVQEIPKIHADLNATFRTGKTKPLAWRRAQLKALKKLHLENEQALCQALLQDENPGVRVAAVEALRESRDQATLQVLEQKMHVDDNEYIRATARRAFERARGTENSQEL